MIPAYHKFDHRQAVLKQIAFHRFLQHVHCLPFQKQYQTIQHLTEHINPHTNLCTQLQEHINCHEIHK